MEHPHNTSQNESKNSAISLLSSEKTESQSIKELQSNLNRLIYADLYSIASPMERAMELIGDKYSFQLLYLLLTEEKQRFVEIEKKIHGISPRTLSARLKHLEKYGLINRYQFPTIPPRVEYEITEKGADLAQAMHSINIWANKWFPFQPPVQDI
ncbi:MAG: helix-turn-helix domain-containing protein [Cyanobacteria bacterium P01_H01_bin.74]